MTDSNRTHTYRSVTRSVLALAGAVGLVLISAGSASAVPVPPLNALDDGEVLDANGGASISILANDIGQDAAPCSPPAGNCAIDDASLDQIGINGSLQIDPNSGEATYLTDLDPAVDVDAYADMIAAAGCQGIIDTFQYTLIGSVLGVPLDPASTDAATITVTAGTGLRTPEANDDTGETVGTEPISAGSLLGNDCDQTGTTPASPANVTAALGTPPTNGTAIVNPDGTASYTANAGFVGTDSFTYTITTADAGPPRSASATVTITVAAPPVVVPPPPGVPGPPAQPPAPGLPATGADNVLPIALGGSGLLLLGSSLVLLGRRRRTEIG